MSAETVLRPNQADLLATLEREITSGTRRIVAQAPTGYGKTVVAAALARKMQDEGKRAIFTVPALSLIDQTVQRFFAEGVRDVGVIQADHVLTNYARPVQIASVQTLQRRRIPAADLVLIDEVHRWFDFYDEWLNDSAWAGVPFIGLSATPWTRGLGRRFDRLIIAATTQELIEVSYLSEFKVFAPASPDLTGIRIVAGDYREEDLSKTMDKPSLVADVVDTWIDRGENRPTLCFAGDRAHAKNLQAKFQAAGISAGYIDAYTAAADRKEIARQFHAGGIKVVCNVGCLTTGIDWDVRCIILARPTKSEILFVQMIGRGLRTADGKSDCLILDHSDNHLRLGFVTDIHHDKLDHGREKKTSAPKEKGALPKKCPKCTFLKPTKVLVCPCCGFKPEPRCTVVAVKGELVEMASRFAARAPTVEKATFYRELKHYAGEHDRKPGWIAHSFRERFGHWPNGLDYLVPLPSAGFAADRSPGRKPRRATWR
jgi:superfamily II DNA or RNA helicase